MSVDQCYTAWRPSRQLSSDRRWLVSRRLMLEADGDAAGCCVALHLLAGPGQRSSVLELPAVVVQLHLGLSVAGRAGGSDVQEGPAAQLPTA